MYVHFFSKEKLAFNSDDIIKSEQISKCVTPLQSSRGRSNCDSSQKSDRVNDEKKFH